MARGARSQPAKGTDNPLHRYAGLAGNDSKTPAWHGLDQGLLGEAAFNIATLGDALLIGATSDGGAIKFIVFHGSEKISRYAADAAEANAILSALAKALDEP